MNIARALTQTLGGIAIGAMALVGATNAQAAIVIGNSFPQNETVSLSGTISGYNQSASAALSITSFTATQLVISVALTNVTPVATPGGNRLIAFGFDVLPDVNRSITSISTGVGPQDWGATLNANISNGVTVDVCAWDGSNCTGGGNQGIGETLTENFILTLTGSFTAPLSLDNFVARYQSTGANSNGSGVIFETGGGGPNPIPVPEPASLVLFGASIAGLGLSLRRRMRKAA